MRARPARSAPCGTAPATFAAIGLRAARAELGAAGIALALARACANHARSLQIWWNTLPCLFLMKTMNKVYYAKCLPDQS